MGLWINFIWDFETPYTNVYGRQPHTSWHGWVRCTTDLYKLSWTSHKSYYSLFLSISNFFGWWWGSVQKDSKLSYWNSLIQMFFLLSYLDHIMVSTEYQDLNNGTPIDSALRLPQHTVELLTCSVLNVHQQTSMTSGWKSWTVFILSCWIGVRREQMIGHHLSPANCSLIYSPCVLAFMAWWR